MKVLHDWRQRQHAHLERAERAVAAHEDRQRRGIAHPVEDFLFTYYTYRPNQLRRWHPGLRCEIPTLDAPHRQWPFYRATADATLRVDSDQLTKRRTALLHAISRLLRVTLQRQALLGCFGLHEWAMLYRIDSGGVRHDSWPLRLPPDHIAAVVEERGLRCTHFDAFRFFTDPARPLNQQPLSREQQLAHEQPGCLHAGMDLYKWAYKLTPAASSQLVLDAFELARDIRYVDMQASPYDLSDLGLTAIAVETPHGRSEYVTRQRQFARRAEPIRRQLLEVCEQLLRAAVPG